MLFLKSSIRDTTTPAPDVNVVAQRRGEQETGVVSASGELDLGTVESFRIQVAGAVASDASARGHRPQTGHVHRLDDAGRPGRGTQPPEREDRDLVIKTQQPIVLRLFEITGLTAVLNIED